MVGLFIQIEGFSEAGLAKPAEPMGNRFYSAVYLELVRAND
jgi:hypothetical protein